ncbi:MAG: RidA family protein [Acidaminococcaceae bacterium]|nr:RidA family protein [Acidaminococcaceae bacterium]
MEFIHPLTGAKANGHYTPGVISGNCLYVSGQLPVNPATDKIEGGIGEQVMQALNNVDGILAAAGLTRNNVALCRVYIPDVAYWDEVNEVYTAFFGEHKPARVVVPCNKLHKDALVEIEAVAELPDASRN